MSGLAQSADTTLSSIIDSTDGVNLKTLSALTGFPVDLIKKELLLNDGSNGETELSLQELRELMLRYLDSTFIF